MTVLNTIMANQLMQFSDDVAKEMESTNKKELAIINKQTDNINGISALDSK